MPRLPAQRDGRYKDPRHAAGESPAPSKVLPQKSQDHVEDKLDESLDESFPASDPPALS